MNLIRNVRVISPDIDYKYANIILLTSSLKFC